MNQCWVSIESNECILCLYLNIGLNAEIVSESKFVFVYQDQLNRTEEQMKEKAEETQTLALKTKEIEMENLSLKINCQQLEVSIKNWNIAPFLLNRVNNCNQLLINLRL